jgi:hypothetical protein
MKILTRLLIIAVFLVSAPLFAQNVAEMELNHFLTEKKALIKETVQFTEKESQVFWPLYDEYMKTYIKLLERSSVLEKGLLEDNEAISEKQAKTILDEHFAIRSENLKAKLSMAKKLRKILPEKKVLQFFHLEEKIEIGFFYHIAENVPIVK